MFAAIVCQIISCASLPCTLFSGDEGAHFWASYAPFQDVGPAVCAAASGPYALATATRCCADAFETCTPAPTVTAGPTPSPTSAPTVQPSPPPTRSPSLPPTPRPTHAPTHAPTQEPTHRPSRRPVPAPIARPTRLPSVAPALEPTSLPTATLGPTSADGNPTPHPAPEPSANAPDPGPSLEPTGSPSVQPTTNPSRLPTLEPLQLPTIVPSRFPTYQQDDDAGFVPAPPSLTPLPAPTRRPTMAPTSHRDTWLAAASTLTVTATAAAGPRQASRLEAAVALHLERSARVSREAVWRFKVASVGPAGSSEAPLYRWGVSFFVVVAKDIEGDGFRDAASLVAAVASALAEPALAELLAAPNETTGAVAGAVSLAVTGTVEASEVGTFAPVSRRRLSDEEVGHGVHLSGLLSGLEAALEAGSVHVHEGNSCDAADAVGNHYFPGLEADPWADAS